MQSTGWPTKMSPFFSGNNFYKNKETFKNFSPQLLDVYRIPLVETTLESIMFYYTLSVINTIFVPCTALLYDSIAAARTLKLSTTPLSISCGIHLIFWWCPLLSEDCFHKLCLSGTPSENSQSSWDLGNRMTKSYWFDAKGVCPMGSYAWGIQVLCSRNEVAPHFWNRRLEYFRHNFSWDTLILHQTDNPQPSYSQDLNPTDYFLRGYQKDRVLKIIHRHKRTSSAEKSDEFHKKCSIELWTMLRFELLLCCHTAATVYGTNIVLINEKV